MVAAVTKQLNKNRSMDKKVTLAQLKEVVQEAYDQVKTNTGRQECRLYSLLGKCQ